MAAGAIITDAFKKKILLELDSDISNRAEYYIGIGRSVQWNSTEAVPTPLNHTFDVRQASLALQSIKKAEDRSFVVPRNTWTSGTKYDAFDDRVVGYPTNAYYVINSANDVYMCVEASKNTSGETQTSTVEPTNTDTGKPFKLSDGYVWKFLYGLTTLNANRFLSANFIPVNFQAASTGGANATLDQQFTIQGNATPGQISNIVVTNPGSGYTSAPTVTINGNGTGAAATATVSPTGTISKITLDSSQDSCRKMGRDYTKASITISGSGGATARAVLSPTNGHGADARDDLRSTQMMFNTKPNGTESGKFNVGQDFRQIMLLRAPFAQDSSAAFTATVGRAGRSLKLQANANNTVLDGTITGATSGATALLDGVDSSVLFYHQSDSSGFKSFASNENITNASGALIGQVTAATSAQLGGAASAEGGAGMNDVFPQKFDVYYIENRAPVVRDAAQTEDIKVVISI